MNVRNEEGHTQDGSKAQLDNWNVNDNSIADRLAAMEEGHTTSPTIPVTDTAPVEQVQAANMPELSPNCLDSSTALKLDLNRINQVFTANKSAPSSDQPFGGDIHKQHQALASKLGELIKKSDKPDTLKLELINTAINHKIFDNQSLTTPKSLLTSAVRFLWPTPHPTPVTPSNSQMILIAIRLELLNNTTAKATYAPVKHTQ
jgi:hypothetical protein